MKIILHIGMGKTGTSAIQKSLAENSETLKSQNAEYLGMWFDLVDEQMNGSAGGLQRLINKSDVMKKKYAQEYVSKLEEISSQTGAKTFILSNEALFLHGEELQTFLAEIGTMMDIQVVLFFRNVYSWLPSAYTQWSIRHKSMRGQNAGFHTEGQRLIKWYDEFDFWKKNYSGRLSVREMTDDNDVVVEFSGAIELSLNTNVKDGFYRRESAALTLLRSMFNSTYMEPIRPRVFIDTFLDIRKMPNKNIQDFIDLSFNFDQIDDIVNKNKSTFDLIKDEVGIDLVKKPKKKSVMPDDAKIREDLLYYLTMITIRQSKEIAALKESILEKK